jgi:hypothetical protein
VRDEAGQAAAAGITVTEARHVRDADGARPVSLGAGPAGTEYAELSIPDATPDGDVESQALVNVTLAAVVAAFDSLPAVQQVLVALTFHEELDVAERELAERYGSGRVRDAIYLVHAEADLGRSENERHAGLIAVERSLRRGQAQVDAEGIAGLRIQVLKLGAWQRGEDAAGPAADLEDEVLRLTSDHADVLGLTVSAAERRSLAAKGHALGPEGDFPIPDAHHLGLAKAEFKKDNLAGHSRAEVRAHINKNAKRLGLPGLDSDDDGDDGKAAMTVALSAGPQERARHAALSGGSAGDIMARYPQFFGR